MESINIDPLLSERKNEAKKHSFELAIAKNKIGDGKQLVRFYTFAQSPHFWLIWVDSSFDEKDTDSYEPVIEALEEEFGSAHPDDFENDEDYFEASEYPTLIDNLGFGLSSLCIIPPFSVSPCSRKSLAQR